ncbi:hypothetical protein HaLaN_10225 [Haematococcus lacustris]|uniref:Uncharacterized protein n=1 Tax=Haematococcus lacustris TaxID=44745 RepID=A0A699YWX8_HAELA|nr:hypothetical protein HaLaN_10225 [Haematococcus lacustris]
MHSALIRPACHLPGPGPRLASHVQRRSHQWQHLFQGHRVPGPCDLRCGLEMYKAVISFLGLFNVKLHLHDIRVATDYLITARWTMDMTVKV